MDSLSYNIATLNINTITSETKLDALRSFIRTQELDIVFLQEVANEQLTIPGFNVVCNVDHARRGTAIAIKQHIKFSHVEKSLDGRLITMRVNNTTLCSCYAHSGTIHRADREQLFNQTIAYYLRHNTPHTILAGDFNCVIRQCDATGNNHSPALHRTVQQLRLVDAWEKLRGNTPGPTYITHNSTSRLDRIYISTSLRGQLRTTDTHVCCFSDHKAVTLRLCLPSLGREPGRGFWTLRPHLLTNENIEEFQIRWQSWTRQKRNFPSWMAWWLTFAKPKTMAFYRWKSKIANDNYKREYQRLYGELQRAYDNYYRDPTVLPVINKVKGRMLAMQREHTQAFLRINETYVAGEALSVFQLGERKRKRTIITHLQGEQDEAYDTSEAIEQHLYGYFQQLYSENEDHSPINDDFRVELVIPENDETNAATMEEITTTEILSSIRNAARRKSPGSDGIPTEFYRRTFDVIHRELNLVLNEALSQQFPSQFVDGVIVLVKKRNSDNTARSYRPISLLNTDFKIFSRILKSRLEKLNQTHHIISNAQKCANSPNNIFQATLSLKDRIAQLIRQKQRAKLISFDFDHAFDRVRHTFLHRTMCSLGINRDFVGLIARISRLSSSRLLVNGHLSRAFPIQRSVRQGDPMSSLLFVLYLDPLIRKLEQVQGNHLVVAYADDVSIISTSAHAIHESKSYFSRFEFASGAKLNLRKTLSVDIGEINGPNTLNAPWLQTTNTVRILGIIFANSIRLMMKLNWDAMVNNFSQITWLHSARSLSLHQKVTLLNVFATSKIWYLSSVLPPSAVHTAKITKTIGTFLWRGIPTRIPMLQLTRPKDKGGLNLHLPSFKCKSLLLNRTLRELDSMPYYRSLLEPANNVVIVCPADLPDVKLMLQLRDQIPPLVLENPTAETIHRFFVEQTDEPKIQRTHPNTRWNKIWRNIAAKQLTPHQRSTLFMIVNEKTSYRKLYHTIGRADSEECPDCNGIVETMQHKFNDCPRVTHAWAHLQRRMTSIAPGRRRLTFSELLRPTLDSIPPTQRARLLKLFIAYITYINNVNGRVDVQSLDFYLECEI